MDLPATRRGYSRTSLDDVVGPVRKVIRVSLLYVGDLSTPSCEHLGLRDGKFACPHLVLRMSID